MKPIKVALCDDQELFIESLSALLTNLQEEVYVAWTARSGAEAIEKASADCPDVLLLDYEFKGQAIDGCETSQLLLEQFPELKILMLSVSCEIEVIRQALRNGVIGYASKGISKTELLHGIRVVVEGDYFLDKISLESVANFLISSTAGIGLKTGSHKSLLTRREQELAPMYVMGKTVKEISNAFFISEDTVESHIKNIRSKTGAASRYEVGEWLKKHGLWVE